MIQRNTKTKKLVIREFEQSQIPLTLEEVYQRVKLSFPITAYSTVYRIILRLEQAGELTQIDWKERGSRYEWAKKRHHHHLVCDCCGEISDIDDQMLSIKLDQVSRKTGFEIQQHSVEIFGLCAACKLKP